MLAGIPMKKTAEILLNSAVFFVTFKASPLGKLSPQVTDEV